MRSVTDEEHIAEMRRRLEEAAGGRAALFYCCCAERCVPLYEAFARAEGWGATRVVRAALDLAWGAVEGSLERDAAAAATEALMRETPHADDFASVETTFAQDACALIAAALACAAGVAEDNARPLDAAFEILRVAHCVEAMGYLDLGDDPRAASVEADFVAGPTFTHEARLQREDLNAIVSAPWIDAELVAGLRDRAIREQYSVTRLLPTQAASSSAQRSPSGHGDGR